MSREETLQVSQHPFKSVSTLPIQIYGEVIIELGDKEYIINAPGGVTIRERVNSVQS